MTTKTIKTVLFASLIAAMILPFSNMGIAEAEKFDYNISDHLDRLLVEYNNNEVKRQHSVDALEEEKSKNNPDRDTVVHHERMIKALTMKNAQLLIKIEKMATLEESYKPTVGIETFKYVRSSGDTIRITDENNPCSKRSSVESYSIEGDINTDIDTIEWDYIVPDELNVGWNIFGYEICENIEFELIDINTRNISKRQSCTLVQSNVPNTSSTLTQTCDCGINDGNILKWQIEIDYESEIGDTDQTKVFHGMHRVR